MDKLELSSNEDIAQSVDSEDCRSDIKPKFRKIVKSGLNIFKARTLEKSSLAQFAGNSSFTSLEFLQKELTVKINEFLTNGDLMLMTDLDPQSFAIQIIQNELKHQGSSIEKLERWIEEATPKQIQQINDKKKEELLKKEAIEKMYHQKRQKEQKK